MGLDLITQRDCEIKEVVPQNELLNQIKDRNRGFAVLNMIVESGKSREEALETSFIQTLQTPEGTKNINVKVSDLIEKTSHLVALGRKCGNCPVSQNKPFGCIGFVSYPVSQKCEKWLTSIAEESYIKGLPYSTIIVFIEDQNINGQRISEMRKHGQTFFESAKPTEIVLSKSLFKKKTINTDKLLDVTFLNGLMQTTHINYLLMLFGGIVSDTIEPKDRYSKFNNEDKKYVYLDLNLPKEHDKSILEFYNYFHHLFVALINGNGVLMD